LKPSKRLLSVNRNKKKKKTDLGHKAGLDNTEKAQVSWACQESKHNSWKVQAVS